MTFDITTIIEALAALIAAIISAFVIPWIKSKTSVAQFEKIKLWAEAAVEAAEQIYTGSGRGEEKKRFVIEFLANKGFKIDADSLDKLIEAAVFNLPRTSAFLTRPSRKATKPPIAPYCAFPLSAKRLRRRRAFRPLI